MTRHLLFLLGAIPGSVLAMGLNLSGTPHAQILEGRINLRPDVKLTLSLTTDPSVVASKTQVITPITKDNYLDNFNKHGLGYWYNTCCIYTRGMSEKNLQVTYPRFTFEPLEVKQYSGNLSDDHSAGHNTQGFSTGFCAPYGNAHHAELRCGYCASNASCKQLTLTNSTCNITLTATQETNIIIYCGLGTMGKTNVFPGYLKASYTIE